MAPFEAGVVVRIAVGVLASLIAASSACAQPQAQQVRRGPAPAWVKVAEPLPLPEVTSGPVFVRRQDALIHLSSEGRAQYAGYRAKILHSSALPMGNISIAWNPQAAPPIVHGIKVYRDGEVTDVLKDASFEILRREDQLEAAKLDGILTAILRVPDLRVGDELEVDLTTFTSDPTLGGNEAGAVPGGQPVTWPLSSELELGAWPEAHLPNDARPRESGRDERAGCRP